MAGALSGAGVDTTVGLSYARLASPLVLLSGTVSRTLLSFCDPRDVGAVVLKTVTLEPRDPNPEPRMHDLGFGALNSIGLFNSGIDRFLDEDLPRFLELGHCFVVSLGEFSVEGFEAVLGRAGRALAGVAGVIGVELNVSCPNVEKGGIAFSRDPAAIARLAGAARETVSGEVWVKVSPAGDVRAQVEAAERGGATAVVVANTMPATAVDERAGRAALGAGSGGLSGPSLMPLNLRHVREARAATRLPIVASGGVDSLAGLAAYARAGADLAGIGTAAMVFPDTPTRVAEELRQALAASGESFEAMKARLVHEGWTGGEGGAA